MVDGNGTVLSYQRYTPWGEVRDGNHTLTSIDFTGQRRDDSGLLFYNARYYDPKLARFMSADTVVPESGALTVRALDATERLHWAKDAVGTAAPPTLNRYAYADNNPLRYTDPTGHVATLDQQQARFMAELIFDSFMQLERAQANTNDLLALAEAVSSALSHAITKVVRELAQAAEPFVAMFHALNSIGQGGQIDEVIFILKYLHTYLDDFADHVGKDDIIAIWVTEGFPEYTINVWYDFAGPKGRTRTITTDRIVGAQLLAAFGGADSNDVSGNARDERRPRYIPPYTSKPVQRE